MTTEQAHAMRPTHSPWVWEGLRTRRVVFALAVVLFLPSVFALAAWVGPLVPGVPFGWTGLAGAAGLLGAAARLLATWPCPRCGRDFGGGFSRPFRATCACCSLPAFADDVEVSAPADAWRRTVVRYVMNPRWRRAVAGFEATGGLALMGTALYAAISGAGVWLVPVAEAFGALALVAGVLLWRDDLRGYELSEAVQAVQMVQLQLPGFSFAVFAGLQMVVYAAAPAQFGVHPGFAGSLVISFGSGATYLGVNLAAVFALVLLRRARWVVSEPAAGESVEGAGAESSPAHPSSLESDGRLSPRPST